MRLLGALAGLAILLVAVASRLLAELLLPADVSSSLSARVPDTLFVAAVGGGLLAALQAWLAGAAPGTVRLGRFVRLAGWSAAGLGSAWAIGRSDGGSIFLCTLPLIPIAAFAGVVERALERESRRTEAGPWVTKLAGTGAIFLAAGVAIIAYALLLLFPGTEFLGLVGAGIGIVVVTLGRLMRLAGAANACSRNGAADTVRGWRAIRVCLLLLMALAAFWYLTVSRLDSWRPQDAEEQRQAPAWNTPLAALRGGTAMAEIQKEMGAAGFKLRCFGNLGPNEKIQDDDTHVCWTIPSTINGIPSRVLAFFFGADGLRYVRFEFASQQWPALRQWFAGLPGENAGTLGRDTGGGAILLRVIDSGLVQTAAPDYTPTVIVLWTARDRLRSSYCLGGQLTPAQEALLCSAAPIQRTP